MLLDPVKDQSEELENNNQIQQALDLLKKGEQEIVLSDKYKDIILVFGNTGSGKSTFTQWITGNDKTLRSKEITAGSGEYVIADDKNRISNSSIQSQTIFPELVVDATTNTAYYDCPGFSDTRSTSHDISATFFIKKVLDHAERIKMIFVVSHHSLRRGVDRKDFMELLKHVADLIKDGSKFDGSIAVIATKVDNQYIKKGKNFVLVGDDKVISGVADFLLEVKRDLTERTKVSGVSASELKFIKDATDFIEILTFKDEARYPKIGIFRRPEEPGPLIDISSLQAEKEEIKKIIFENMNFTIVNDDDFGYTISDKSKNDIFSLQEQINRHIWIKFGEIAGKLDTYYHDLVKKIRSRVKTFLLMHDVVVSNQTEAEMFSRMFKKGYNVTWNFLKEHKDSRNPQELAKKINTILTDIDAGFSRDTLLDIESKGSYLNFLQIVSRDRLGTRPWTDLFRGLPTYLSESGKLIQNDVDYVTAKIVEQMHSNLNSTARVIHEYFLKKSHSFEIEKLSSILSQDYVGLFNIVEDIRRKDITTKKLLAKIHGIADRFRINLPRKNVVKIKHLGEYFEYVQIISENQLGFGSFGWCRHFDDIIEYLEQSKIWYRFLNDLYLKFSTYIIQKDRRNYNVANIEDFGKYGKEEGIHITEQNFQKFLQKISDYNIEENGSVGNIKVTESRLKELNHVLELTVKHKPVLSCSQSSFSIRGTYITVADILHNFFDYHDGSCDPKILFQSKNMSLDIFALNSIFIDTDVHGIRVTTKIISPKWEIIGSRQLELEGEKGKTYLEQDRSEYVLFDFFQRKLKARNGLNPGSRGDDGKPGRAGGPGGTFLGIGSLFVNGANLSVINSGGNGGSGQDGGNGYAGRNGRSPDESVLENLYCSPNLCYNRKQIGGFDCDKIRYFHREATYHTYGAVGSSVPGTLQCEYKIFGKPGVKGGNGGNGGKGGKGGYPGQVVLFELGAKSDILKKFKNGQEGACGKGGIGGAAGNDGDNIVIEYYHSRHGSQKWSINNRISHGRSETRKNGTDCSNALNIEDPKPPTSLETTTFLNEFKRYSRQHMKDRFRRTSLRQFYSELESDSVRNIYNTMDLVNEFKGLEEQFVELNKYVDFVPFYQSLLGRIIDRANRVTSIEKSVIRRNEHKKVLSYLYTASLEKIYNLNENSEFELIIDITRYLDLLKTDIESLKDSQKVYNKLKVINKLKVNYKTCIDKKIEEAESLIKNHVTPEIEIIGKQIDDQIDLLILKTIELKNQTIEERTELIEKRKKMGEGLVLRGLFSGLKLMGQVLTFLGPIGAVAGTIIGTTSATAESLALDGNTNTIEKAQLPASVKSAPQILAHQIKTYNNKKIADFDRMIEDILLETEKYPDILNETSKAISDIKIRSKKISKNDVKKVKLLENELKRELNKKASELKSQKFISDQKSKKALDVVEKFNKAIKLCEVGFDVYNKYKNDKNKLDEITEAIKQSENNFQKLKQFEDNIHNTITPMLQNMEDGLYDIAKELDKKSRVSLDVTKWQVKDTLNDMKLMMKQLVRGFQDVEDNLPRCLEKLEEVMTTLIILYDHIHNYQEQQNLANYIADISCPLATGINITNVELTNAVSDLEVLIRSNLILQQYKLALNAFKQYVFPFANLYMEELILPEHLIWTETIENLITQALTHIEKIKSKVELYKLSVKKIDKYIHIAEFSSDYVSSKPFFVWENLQYRPLISDLLSGQEVVLKADITRSPTTKDAIKFNSILFNFKSHNDTMQKKLNDTLKAFLISATHLGNSYYKCDGRTYMIPSDSQMIQYSFETNSDGYPVDKNIVYEKIQTGNLMLSPYALWKIKLINSTDNISFDNLKVFEDKIDLELVGSGSYLSSEAKALNLNMENYYKPEDTYNDDFETNNIGPETIRRNKNWLSNDRYTRSSIRIDETDPNSNRASNNLNAFVPINNVCNFFKKALLKLKNASAHKVKTWFANYDGTNDEKKIESNCFVYHDDVITYELNDIKVDNTLLDTKCEIGKITKFIDSENHVNNVIKYDSFDMQGTLLWLNLIFYKKTETKFRTFINHKTNKYAHDIAYNAYTSKYM